ncbi:hypothetical protein HAHI6034_05690 [Hathewaya histolytica]|uniref:Uncharacterized protein n=1 Tax=Hathewaya histolytica TaxID=1498 RepID=A0A4U9RDK0_HATHI|nr:hypothetical protein [Hathewaya histolytica]VTQ89814.1 Uncharacterised protein [Hathewaya histolytica]
MQIVNWNDSDDCIMGSKAWVKMEDGEPIIQNGYKKGSFPIVWCDHDDCPCTAVYGVDFCAIYTDHVND